MTRNERLHAQRLLHERHGSRRTAFDPARAAKTIATTGLLVSLWHPGSAQTLLPTVYNTHLGVAWSGPNTCIVGQRGSVALQKYGEDPNFIWFDRKIVSSDSASLRSLWSKEQQCVTDIPGREGAFVATLFAGKVIKMTYIFGRPGGANSLAHWHGRMVEAHGPGTVVAGARRWIVDSLEVVEGLPTALWQGGVPVQVRSLSGCQMVRAEMARLKLGETPAKCW